MPQLQFRNAFTRFLWKLDARVSSAVFETWDGLRRMGSAYSSFLHRHFRLSGIKRIVVDLLDDGATFGTIFAFGLLAYALPPFSGTGDVWNRGREYAVTFTDANGEIIGRRGIRQDDAIPLEDIPPHMIKAVLATEDARFFDHFGVDIIGTLRAIIHNAKSDSSVQGGSSLTQQVAKNLFLSPERTIRRKVHEAFLAMWIEARLSKQEILKLYLDRSYLGGGNYGIEAAAQYYFGKSVRDVTLSEAAMLAGLFKAPSKFAPHANPEAARARANIVLYRMLDAGFITQGELLQARREPAAVISQSLTDSPDWFLDKAYRDTIALLDAEHITGEYVIEVKTTIDMKLQAAAQKVIDDEIAAEGAQYNFSQGAAITMTPDGAIKALVGGRDYATSQFNRATDALRQTGSAFKPFVYLAALLNGYKPTDIVVDAPVSVGNWSPGNYSDKYEGRVTLTTALAKSLNSVAVRLMLAVGRPAIIETAHLVGIRGELETWAPMVLGTSALSLIDITGAFATFAAGGKRPDPYTVLEIRRANGDVLYARSPDTVEPPRQVVAEEKIAELNSMLKEVVKSGTARKADLGFAPQGGKTGTNQGYRDAWYIGFTAHNVTGVWIGNDDFTPMNKVTGGLIPAPMWKSIMLVAEQGQKPEALAGIPYDDSYTQVAAVDAPAAAQAVANADETDQAAAEAGAPAESNGDVNQVLNGMFNLFDDQQKPATTKIVRQRQDALVLPKANADSGAERRNSFFDSLFGSGEKPDKPRKRKPIFGFY
ncbi:MAG: PBP1A family penicillin-binding protein [Rhizobiales bacterium]|nr:PBP1A family penicillin-binding protein [Hyphomicrobiales bacterium]MBI3674854.1 PBP1A family penicillin-binding protein [Hyphomicrobiales bacterium]